MPQIHITDENSPSISITETPTETPKEQPKKITDTIMLKAIGQMGRKVGYWMDDDIQLPPEIKTQVVAAFNAMKQINKYMDGQMVDISESINPDGSRDQYKSIPTNPQALDEAKIMSKSKFPDSSDKASLWASKYYREQGGTWKKKSVHKKRTNG